MPRTIPILAFILVAIIGSCPDAYSSGISVDTGLTPAEDRWILRSQVRFLSRDDDPSSMDREMDAYMFPLVIAYGLRSDLTLIARQPFIHRRLTRTGSSEDHTGLGDTVLLAKYRAFRLNRPGFTFGVAPTIGIEFPSGADEFSSETWDIHSGLYLSGRSGPWGTDFNVAYRWNGFSGEGRDDTDPGDEFSLDWALAHQFPVPWGKKATWAPVVEVNYERTWPDERHGHSIGDSGESILSISPGVKYSTEDFILEGLLQIPVWQDQQGIQPERELAVIAGIRILF